MLHSLTVYPLFFPSVGPMELAIIFTIVLILFGPGKLPSVFKAMGDGIRQFKDASKAITTDVTATPALPKEEKQA